MFLTLALDGGISGINNSKTLTY